jgi:hypothetical protein
MIVVDLVRYVGKIRHDHGKHPIQPERPTMMWRSVIE